MRRWPAVADTAPEHASRRRVREEGVCWRPNTLPVGTADVVLGEGDQGKTTVMTVAAALFPAISETTYTGIGFSRRSTAVVAYRLKRMLRH
jgi:hypothetical protein